MEILQSKSAIDTAIQDEEMVLLLFGTTDCSVCKQLVSSIPVLLSDYPKISGYHINVQELAWVRGVFSIFTAPVILLYIRGKEYLRMGRFIRMSQLKEQLDRYYTMVFDDEQL